MKVYLGFEVPEQWKHDPEGFVQFISILTNQRACRPTNYYVED